MNQAWLIMAHNEFEVLQRLVESLDSPESDFYLHFDKKVKALPEIRTLRGRLFVLKDRIDVRWGTVSQLQAELMLLETAQKNGPYSHYHILSGTHLPLKPVEDLVRFYEGHPEEEIVRFWDRNEGDADFKLRRYHFLVGNIKCNHAISRLVWKSALFVQKKLGIRRYKQCKFLKTDQWLSLTPHAASYLVSHKDQILRKYRWSFCCDEYFIASELEASPESFRFYDCPNLLFVEFDNDSPRSFPLSSFSQIQKKDYFWARKFTSR